MLKTVLKTKSFLNRVLNVVSKIPKGKTLAYKQVAEKAGNSKAFRVVGNIMSKNKNLKIPCHRVIRSDGKIGKYNGLRGDKISLLKKEKAIK